MANEANPMKEIVGMQHDVKKLQREIKKLQREREVMIKGMKQAINLIDLRANFMGKRVLHCLIEGKPYADKGCI